MANHRARARSRFAPPHRFVAPLLLYCVVPALTLRDHTYSIPADSSKPLGPGSCGEVFKVLDRVTQQYFAAKIARKKRRMTDLKWISKRKTIVGEYKTLLKLSGCDTIIEVLPDSLSSSEECAGFVMEYSEHGDLQSVIGRGGLDNVRSVCQDLILALKFMYDRSCASCLSYRSSVIDRNCAPRHQAGERFAHTARRVGNLHSQVGRFWACTRV